MRSLVGQRAHGDRGDVLGIDERDPAVPVAVPVTISPARTLRAIGWSPVKLFMNQLDGRLSTPDSGAAPGAAVRPGRESGL